MSAQGDELLHRLRTQSEDAWITEGEANTLTLFHAAAERVPAYKDFLKKNSVKADRIRTMEDFSSGVPVVDKENYVAHYSLPELSWDGTLAPGAWISQSSGTTRESFFWPRFPAQMKETAFLHDVLFREWYQSTSKNTLFVICFHLGSHIAGMVTATAIADILRDGTPGALITPGLNKDDIIRSVTRLSPHFEQTILIGYPPFLKDVITAGCDAGIDWAHVHVQFLFAAESFPESWRRRLKTLARMDDQSCVALNIYGSADIGFMAHETEDTLSLRAELETDVNLRNCLGATEGFSPPIFQYHPWNRHFEIVNGEIVCTADAGIPFVRYNMHDRGAVLRWSDVSVKHIVPRWHLPLVSVHGRSDYSATLYGLNIYPEHVREILSNDRVSSVVSGKFFLKTAYDDNENQILEVHLELAQGSKQYPDMNQQITNIVADLLATMNGEYAKLRTAVGMRARPVIVLYENGSPVFQTMKMKHRYIVKERS